MQIEQKSLMTVRTRQEIEEFAATYDVSEIAVIPPTLILRVRPLNNSRYENYYTYHIYQETRPDRYVYSWSVHSEET